jgi:predicted nucleic acid-binding protein
MILLDTNILIEIYRGNVAIASIIDSIPDIAVCNVVRAELFYGARDKRDLQEISADLMRTQVSL